MSSKKSTRSQSYAPASAQIGNQIVPYLLVLTALLISICFLFTENTGMIGSGMKTFLCGLFSGGAFTIPFFLLNFAIFWRKDRANHCISYKIYFSLLCLLLTSILIHAFTAPENTFHLVQLFKEGTLLIGGGMIGGFFGTLLIKGFGFAGTLILTFPLLFLFGIFLFGLTPKGIWLSFCALHREKKQIRTKKPPKKEPYFDPLPLSNLPEPEEETILSDSAEQVKAHRSEKRPPTKPAEETVQNEIDEIANQEFDFSTLFSTPEQPAMVTSPPLQESGMALSIERKHLSEKPNAVLYAEPETQSYQFPPISLLKPPVHVPNVDVSAELQENATKLVETLKSFHVKTRITHVSRGPTITRYELAPEVGTKVRSILNLVDDISLNLATTGVRIESPVPGKAAVGIEVPNKTVATVAVRELIETIQFTQSPSRLTACLGMDVAGTPIYLDIGKMPHLLIAGATGMGKSVCINSLIVSLLYKAKPEEVKLILIDPKKVELNIYNGIPHLLVPVVSDPKKAAGTLQWAVGEMERRFERIESLGVRDIKNYNLMLAENSDTITVHEFLPQIVIIIDELADLMMTAPDDVEESICRLAQKARAAGMHLIIGTQRPSVDVITGLIKANIPSRIAFTVASQIDSRTIIDTAGAEKLIGRGDMLYAPVGISKPIRVQGAFVSEKEVELITGFLKEQAGTSQYNSDVIRDIEKEAARCGQAKKNLTLPVNQEEEATTEHDETGNDPLLKSAIELAVETGKISTSLIQRRLSLGYGRAAKIIDTMQEMGIVSPPEGQKPRSVRINKQQYMELLLRNDPFG